MSLTLTHTMDRSQGRPTALAESQTGGCLQWKPPRGSHRNTHYVENSSFTKRETGWINNWEIGEARHESFAIWIHNYDWLRRFTYSSVITGAVLSWPSATPVTTRARFNIRLFSGKVLQAFRGGGDGLIQIFEETHPNPSAAELFAEMSMYLQHDWSRIYTGLAGQGFNTSIAGQGLMLTASFDPHGHLKSSYPGHNRYLEYNAIRIITKWIATHRRWQRLPAWIRNEMFSDSRDFYLCLIWYFAD